jgi:ethanolamine ammonia-lyase small subunit
MNLPRLRDFTTARVGLARCGNGLPTGDVLTLQLAHARAREAVHSSIDAQSIGLELRARTNSDFVTVRSRAADRAIYLRRPDLGRQLSSESRALLSSRKGTYDVAFVIADGLSALAVHMHAAPLIETLLGFPDFARWKFAPFTIIEQGRVAIGDEIAECLGASLAVVLIGERPGLSSADSLGVYMTWDPHPGRTDAERNCISNIRSEGLSYEAAAMKLVFLMNEARRRKISGVNLKDDRPAAIPELKTDTNG